MAVAFKENGTYTGEQIITIMKHTVDDEVQVLNIFYE
jgi:hypothetical protein